MTKTPLSFPLTYVHGGLLKRTITWQTRNLGKNTYCTASSYLFVVQYKEFHLVSIGTLRASTLVNRPSSWTYPPSSLPLFSSLSLTSGFVMGGVPLGVFFSTCYFYKLQNSSVERVDFLTWATNALALFQNRPNYKNQDVGTWKSMWETRVGYTSPCTLPNMYIQREQASMQHIADMFF